MPQGPDAPAAPSPGQPRLGGLRGRVEAATGSHVHTECRQLQRRRWPLPAEVEVTARGQTLVGTHSSSWQKKTVFDPGPRTAFATLDRCAWTFVLGTVE